MHPDPRRQAARTAAVKRGLPAHGTLWVIAQAVRAGKVQRSYANSLTNTLLSAGARYPFQPDGFEAWATGRDLIPSGTLGADP